MQSYIPTYHPALQRVLVTVHNEGYSYPPVPTTTRALGVYDNRAEAERAFEDWGNALEGSTAPANEPWAGVDLPEVPDVDGGIPALVDVALASEDVVLVSSNGVDFFVMPSEEAQEEGWKMLASPDKYGLEPDELDGADWQDAYAAVERPDWRLIQMIRG